MKSWISKTNMAIVFLFVAWSIYYIYRSSYIAIDGNRYFSLLDDAMISMRYAWNLSHGAGLVWNAGEYVEGYTNLLMTLVMAIATFLFDKKAAVLAIQILGIPTVLCAGFLTRQIARKLYPLKPAIADLAFIGTLFYFPLSYWSLLGMETGLLTVLLLAGLLCGLCWLESGRSRDLFLAALFLGLAFLTRNESILLALLVFGFLAYKKANLLAIRNFSKDEILRSLRLLRTTEYKQLSDGLLALFYAGLLFGVFVLGQTIFRLWYYGELVPNTYTLKVTGIPLSLKIRWGWTYIRPFLMQSSILLGIAIIELIRSRLKNLFLFLFLAILLVYQVAVGGDVWPEWRIVAPGIPFAFILVASALCAAGEWIQQRPGLARVRNILAFTPLVLLVLNLIVLDLPFSGYVYNNGQDIQASRNEHNTDIAIAINTMTTKEASIGVFWAGVIPYYADRRAVDFLGKTDKVVANLPPHLDISLPGHNKFDLGYSIRTLQPTYIQDFQRGKDNQRPWVIKHYVRVNYKTQYGDITLILLRDQPSVLWNMGTVLPWAEDRSP